MFDIPKTYDPKEAERDHYARWEERGYFAPEINQDKNAPVFTIVIPPPNVTGSLTGARTIIRCFRICKFCASRSRASFTTFAIFSGKVTEESRLRPRGQRRCLAIRRSQLIQTTSAIKA